MIVLEPNECRVLGVLVEKAHTTPAQYPLSLNACVTGSNQKNNRDPVTNLDEDDVFDALDGLRRKGLAREVMLSGSRVSKYKHDARDGLGVTTSELVMLTELLLRGPQTLGELRGRASRMHPIESLESAQSVLDGLASREPALITPIPPAPGSRAGRFMQLLCPALHNVEAIQVGASPSPEPAASAPAAAPAPQPPSPDLARRVADLEARVGRLEELVRARL